MTTEKYLKVAVPLTLAGVLFAGYLSSVKLFVGTCAFNESCPIFLGYPACYFGFLMFSAMFASSVVALVRRTKTVWPLKVNAAVSALGILFSGYFTVGELSVWFTDGFKAFGLLGLSTCAYGLLFYIAVFVFTLAAMMKKGAVPAQPAAPAMTPPQTPAA